MRSRWTSGYKAIVLLARTCEPVPQSVFVVTSYIVTTYTKQPRSFLDPPNRHQRLRGPGIAFSRSPGKLFCSLDSSARYRSHQTLKSPTEKETVGVLRRGTSRSTSSATFIAFPASAAFFPRKYCFSRLTSGEQEKLSRVFRGERFGEAAPASPGYIRVLRPVNEASKRAGETTSSQGDAASYGSQRLTGSFAGWRAESTGKTSPCTSLFRVFTAKLG